MKKRLFALVAMITILSLFTTLVYADVPENAASESSEPAIVLEVQDEDVSEEAEAPEAAEEAEVSEVTEETEVSEVTEETEETKAAEEAGAPELTEEADDAETGENASGDDIPADDVSDPALSEDPDAEVSPEEEAVSSSALDFAQTFFAALVGENFSPADDVLTYRVLDENAKTVAVTGGESGQSSIIIPETVTYEDEKYTVTEVARGAFKGDGSIKSLTISSSVKIIRAEAFSNCISLSAINFNEGLTEIENNAFAYTGKDENTVPATIDNLTFPASLVTVADGAFHCIPVKTFALKNGSLLKEIPCGFLAADGKDGYPGVETESKGFFDFIHNLMFEFSSFTPANVAKACDCLLSIDFGDENSLELIGMGAFKNQTHLTSIDFGESSRADSLVLCNGVFVAAGNQAGIDTLVFPANLSQIGMGDVPDTSGSFNYARVRNLVFADNCKLSSIPDGFFEVSGVGSNGYPGKGGDGFVKDDAQIAANSLETIDFGDSNNLKEIGNGAFRNQSHMTSIDFGSSQQDLIIRAGAFVGVGNNGCLVENEVDEALNKGIETLTLPSNLSSLESGAFEYAKICNLVFSKGCRLKMIPFGFLGVHGVGCDGYPGKEKDWMTGEESFVKDLAQLAANSLETIDFGEDNSLNIIRGGAFFNQSHLKNIDFGTSQQELEISYGAFMGVGNNGYLVENGVDEVLNEGIETLTLPANLTQLLSAFEYARIKNLVLSDNCRLSTIPTNFLGIIGEGCNGEPGKNKSGDFVEDLTQLAANSLETINFGKNNCLSSIKYAAFKNQSHVTEINFGTSSITELTIFDAAFNGVGNNTYLYENNADESLSKGIDTLTLPKNLSYMNSGAFSFAGIKNLVFDSGIGISNLADGSFQDLDLMEELILGEDCTLTKLDGGVFSKCNELTCIDLSSSVITVIGDAIKENPKLTSITFPKKLQSITGSMGPGWREGQSTFYGCENVNELHFTNADSSEVSFGEGSFLYLNESGTVYVPFTSTDEQIAAYKAKLIESGMDVDETEHWKIRREHVHTLVKTDAVAPTCTEDGNTEYWTCTDPECGKFFSDAEGKNQIAEHSWVLEATGHDWGEWIVTKEATTEEEGEETRTCINDPSHKETRTIPVKEPELTFVDVSEDDWFAKAVAWAVGNGVTSGYDNNMFKPYLELTRAMAVTFLYNMAGQPNVDGLGEDFSDVDNNDWFSDPVKWAVANKITSGYGGNAFKPDALCTRAMAVTFIANYAKYKGTYKQPEIGNTFTDVKADDWFAGSVNWAVNNKITSGYGKNTFKPGTVCNRAMMVTFLYNYNKVFPADK